LGCTHDPALFIRPKELAQKLQAAGFDVGRFVGLGPRGLNWRFDFVFGFLPTMAIQYLGQARAAR
jgi:2-polyprenyl-6-hydroxyphenyl methylase/3-demethylubiquinone-9 3-methyltransferase